MKKFLLSKAAELINGYNESFVHSLYEENENRDAISSNDDWLKNGTSWIYKVGVLVVIDANKCDFMWILIATQRNEFESYEFIGLLHFNKGENDDVARTLNRVMKELKFMHPVFSECVS